MSFRLRMADIKASRIPQVLKICATDDRLADYVNEAQERILSRGNWVGTQAKHVIHTISGKITWPRHVLVPNAVSLCGCALTIRNQWFEFLENGPGLQDETCGMFQVHDRGYSVGFDDIDIQGLGDKKVRIYCDLADDVGKKVTLQGTDENGSRVMTQVGGVWIDGEQITLAQSPGTLSTKKYTKLLGAIKEETYGFVRGYEVDAATSLNTKALFVYDPTETLPIYRRSVIAGYGEEDATDVRTVTAWTNLRHIPVRRDADVNDNDYLLITSIPALKEMCMAIKYREDHDRNNADRCEATCRAELEGQSLRHQGEGVVLAVRAAPSSTWGAGAVPNAINHY